MTNETTALPMAWKNHTGGVGQSLFVGLLRVGLVNLQPLGGSWGLWELSDYAVDGPLALTRTFETREAAKAALEASAMAHHNKPNVVEGRIAVGTETEADAARFRWLLNHYEDADPETDQAKVSLSVDEPADGEDINIRETIDRYISEDNNPEKVLAVANEKLQKHNDQLQKDLEALRVVMSCSLTEYMGNSEEYLQKLVNQGVLLGPDYSRIMRGKRALARASSRVTTNVG